VVNTFYLLAGFQVITILFFVVYLKETVGLSLKERANLYSIVKKKNGSS